MPVVLELGKILGGFFAAIVACALGPAAGFNSRRKASRRLRPSRPSLVPCTGRTRPIATDKRSPFWSATMSETG
jgi:hypothetical protein